MALTKDGLASRFRDHVSVQDYSPKQTIEGVKFLPLRRFSDDGGSFLELVRLDGGRLAELPDFEVRQASYSTMMPGAVKAFHLHFVQSELWFVPPESRLLMGLLDVRAGSKTEGASMRFVAGDGQARYVYIPAGVAHGAANLTDRIGQVIYFMDRQFTPEPDKTDEKRLPWDILGAQFWSMEKG